MDILKAAPELLADYVNFLLKFSYQPRVCMGNHVAVEEGEPRVSGRLLAFALISVGVTLVLVQIGAAVGMAEDSSSLLVVLDRIGEKLLPVAAAVSIIAASIIAHLALKIAGVFSRFAGHQPFEGRAANSVNAALGFSALAIPVFTLVIIGLRVAVAQDVEVGTGVFLATVLPLNLGIFAYLIAAFAGVHNLKLFHAVYLFGATGALFVYGAKLLDRVL